MSHENKRTPDELMKEFDDGCRGLSDIDMGSLLFEIIDDVVDSVYVALVDAEVEERAEIIKTVYDYVGNHYGD